jgi:hypothetical protein
VLNSTVLEVAIGLLFCFGSMALIASSIYEAIASLLKLRAESLLAGVKALLNDPKFDGLAMHVYNHALVNPRDDAQGSKGKPPAMKPSYIEPRAFAIALVDSISELPNAGRDLKQQIEALPNDQLKKMLLGIYGRVGGDVGRLQTAIAAWFDAGMDRVSGGYKRQAQLFTFVIALALAALVNVDTFHLFRTLWTHPAVAAKVAATASAAADAAQDGFQNLDALPVGWTKESLAGFSWVVPFGWLITALSALFGAPFWFDLLQRLVNLRGTGGKPGERQEAATVAVATAGPAVAGPANAGPAIAAAPASAVAVVPGAAR